MSKEFKVCRYCNYRNKGLICMNCLQKTKQLVVDEIDYTQENQRVDNSKYYKDLVKYGLEKNVKIKNENDVLYDKN